MVTRYAKLIDGEWKINPNKITYNGRNYYNPKARHYLAAGFLPLIEAEEPEDMWNEYGEPMYAVSYEYGTEEHLGYVVQKYIPIE